eukprot:685350-Karenia_brevis.AAC.1
MTKWTFPPNKLSKNCKVGKPAERREAAMLIISASVELLDVATCCLHNHMMGRKEFGTSSAKKPPEVDLVWDEFSAKSASV